jgi:hypothetical protein
MSEGGWSESFDYTEGLDEDEILKPYLMLTLRASDGTHELKIPGLVDTGADRSVLPRAYAEMLGYTTEDLKSTTMEQVQGSFSALIAGRPCLAFLPGMEELQFEMRPLFVDGSRILWGRDDLMRTYEVCVSQKKETLTLRLPA